MNLYKSILSVSTSIILLACSTSYSDSKTGSIKSQESFYNGKLTMEKTFTPNGKVITENYTNRGNCYEAEYNSDLLVIKEIKSNCEGKKRTIIEYKYDSKKRLTEILKTFSNDDTYIVSFDYNKDGNLLYFESSRTYKKSGKKSGRSLEWSYHENGNVKSFKKIKYDFEKEYMIHNIEFNPNGNFTKWSETSKEYNQSLIGMVLTGSINTDFKIYKRTFKPTYKDNKLYTLIVNDKDTLIDKEFNNQGKLVSERTVNINILQKAGNLNKYLLKLAKETNQEKIDFNNLDFKNKFIKYTNNGEWQITESFLIEADGLDKSYKTKKRVDKNGNTLEFIAWDATHIVENKNKNSRYNSTWLKDPIYKLDYGYKKAYFPDGSLKSKTYHKGNMSFGDFNLEINRYENRIDTIKTFANSDVIVKSWFPKTNILRIAEGESLEYTDWKVIGKKRFFIKKRDDKGVEYFKRNDTLFWKGSNDVSGFVYVDSNNTVIKSGITESYDEKLRVYEISQMKKIDTIYPRSFYSVHGEKDFAPNKLSYSLIIDPTTNDTIGGNYYTMDRSYSLYNYYGSNEENIKYYDGPLSRIELIHYGRKKPNDKVSEVLKQKYDGKGNLIYQKHDRNSYEIHFYYNADNKYQGRSEKKKIIFMGGDGYEQFEYDHLDREISYKKVFADGDTSERLTKYYD